MVQCTNQVVNGKLSVIKSLFVEFFFEQRPRDLQWINLLTHTLKKEEGINALTTLCFFIFDIIVS